jgi:hypothetical protein
LLSRMSSGGVGTENLVARLLKRRVHRQRKHRELGGDVRMPGKQQPPRHDGLLGVDHVGRGKQPEIDRPTEDGGEFGSQRDPLVRREAAAAAHQNRDIEVAVAAELVASRRSQQVRGRDRLTTPPRYVLAPSRITKMAEKSTTMGTMKRPLAAR